MSLPPGINLADNAQPRVIGAVSVTWGLAVIAIFLRFTCRRISKAGLWWDDYLMIPAFIFTTILSWITLTWMIEYGFGQHIFVQRPERIPASIMVFLKSLFIAEICYTGTIVFAKFSILAFYWRLFARNSFVRWSVITITTIVTMWGLAVFIIVVTQCRPLKGFWNKTVQADCTVDSYKFFYGNSTPNIITDILLMLTPLPAIWTLHLELRQKISLSVVFLLGIFVTAVSVTRLIVLLSLDPTAQDVTWVFVGPQIWTCVELNIAVVCGCLPQLRPLLLLITTGSTVGSTSASNGRAGAISPASSKRKQWSSFGMSKDSGTETSVTVRPLVSSPETPRKNGSYIELRRMENTSVDQKGLQDPKASRPWDINVTTNWDVTSHRSAV